MDGEKADSGGDVVRQLCFNGEGGTPPHIPRRPQGVVRLEQRRRPCHATQASLKAIV